MIIANYRQYEVHFINLDASSVSISSIIIIVLKTSLAEKYIVFPRGKSQAYL